MFINTNKDKLNNPTKQNNFEAIYWWINFKKTSSKSKKEDVKKEAEKVVNEAIQEIKQIQTIILNRDNFENDEAFEEAKNY